VRETREGSSTGHVKATLECNEWSEPVQVPSDMPDDTPIIFGKVQRGNGHVGRDQSPCGAFCRTSSAIGSTAFFRARLSTPTRRGFCELGQGAIELAQALDFDGDLCPTFTEAGVYCS